LTNRGQKSLRLLPATLDHAQPGKAERGAQLPEQGALLARDAGCRPEAILRLDGARAPRLPQQPFALQAPELCPVPILAAAICPRHGAFQLGASLLETTQTGQAFGESAEELGVAHPPAGLLAGFQRLRDQLDTGSEFAPFDEQRS